MSISKNTRRVIVDIICSAAISKSPKVGALKSEIVFPVASIRLNKIILLEDDRKEIFAWLEREFDIKSKLLPNGDWRIESSYLSLLGVFEKVHEGKQLNFHQIRRRKTLGDLIKKTKRDIKRFELEENTRSLFDGVNTLRWRCSGCGGFVKELKDWDEVLAISKDKKPELCKNGHRNFLHIWGSEIEYSGSPISIKELVDIFKKGKA